MDEQPKEDGEDFEDLSSVLEHLGLSEYKSTFDNEKIDIESFVRVTGFIVFHLYIHKGASVIFHILFLWQLLHFGLCVPLSSFCAQSRI